MTNGTILPSHLGRLGIGDNYSFKICLTHSMPWLDSAQALFDSAELLYVSSRKLPSNDADESAMRRQLISPVIAMLLGLGMENAFKGLWVFRNRKINKVRYGEPLGLDRNLEEQERNELGISLPEEIDTHDLCGLAKQCSFQLSDRESDLLVFLNSYVIWRGRYPSPRKSFHRALRTPTGKLLHPGVNIAELFTEGVIQKMLARILSLCTPQKLERVDDGNR